MHQRITLHAGLDGFRGYGLHLIEIARHFIRRNIHPSIRPLFVQETKNVAAQIPADIRSLIVTGRQPEDWELMLAPPHYAPTPGKKTAYFTMWESSILPDPMMNMINQAAAVIVPSRWCYDVFKERGILKPPIFHVPLGVDENIFKWRPLEPGGPTVFACAGRTKHGRERKGLDGVIRAFKAAFPYDKNVRLLVKCHPDCGLPDVSDTRIEVDRSHLSPTGVADWLARCHVFVTAAQGEGWGLWQHQAMAIGRPCIAPVYGGLRDFMGEGNCFPVSYRLGPTTGQWCGQWAYPDLGSMIEQMRHCHSDRFDVITYAVEAAKSVAGLTWARSCDELIHVLCILGALKPANAYENPTFNRGGFQSPKLHHGDYSIPKIPSVPEQCAQRKWKCTEYKFTIGEDEAAFNPSIAGEHLFVRLSKTTDGNRDKSTIWVKPPELFPAEMTQIKLPGVQGDWFEDPRALKTDNGFALSYTRVSKGCHAVQELAFLDDSYNVMEVWHPELGHNGVSPKTATGAEKNWIWFEFEGHWHCIHWLEPMRVYRVNIGKQADKWETDGRNPRWMHGVRHGGGHPTRIGDEYFGFCHSLLPWYGANRSRYFISAYAFEAKPPFRMTRLSTAPLLRSDDDIRTNPCSCIIAGGADFSKGVWAVSVGSRDEQCFTVEIPHSDVIASMENV